jgi:hypothetical protein
VQKTLSPGRAGIAMESNTTTLTEKVEYRFQDKEKIKKDEE